MNVIHFSMLGEARKTIAMVVYVQVEGKGNQEIDIHL